jgi:hypothetical protein
LQEAAVVAAAVVVVVVVVGVAEILVVVVVVGANAATARAGPVDLRVSLALASGIEHALLATRLASVGGGLPHNGASLLGAVVGCRLDVDV